MSIKNYILIAMNKGILNFLPDKFYLKIRYYIILGKKLDLKNPKNFNEKCQWLKLHDRNPKYNMMVDKCEAKEYVKKIIGDDYIIPTYGIYNDFDEIDFEKLPKQFVIKCTHDSGGLVIVKNKSQMNINKIRRKIKKSMKRNYYYAGREWPYKNLTPRIIIEKYMEDKNNSSMRDYKFFCFSGEPQLMYLSEGLDDHSTAKMSFFDMNFNITDCKRKDYQLLDYKVEKPKNFEKMKEFAIKLSKNIKHIRVDFYEINGKLYFGELTFFTCSGMIPFESDEWDEKLGNYIKI